MPDEHATPDTSVRSARRAPPWRLIAAALLGVAFVVFVIQNTGQARVTWLFFETNGPVWVVILAAAVAGALLSEVIGFLARRSKRRR